MKRKIVALIVLLALFTGSVSASNMFELTQVHYPIYANGELVAPDELPVLSYQDRTYVPLRKLSEASGLSVYFDDAQQSISIYNSPLLEAQVYAAVANAYKQAIDVAECYKDYMDVADHCIGNINNSGPYVYESLERLVNYKDKYIPQHIADLNREVELVDNLYKTAHGIWGESPVSDLYTRLYYAQEALKNAEYIYNIIYGYACGMYTYSYFADMYYGNNEDGYVYQIMEQYGYVQERASINFDEYINMALGVQ